MAVSGTSDIGDNVTTTGEQSYSGAVTQTGNVTYTGVDTDADGEGVNFGSTVNSGGFNLTVAGGGGFAGAVSNVASLTADHIDTESTISSGTVAVSGASDIGGTVTTTGSQSYTGAATISADLMSDVDIVFGSTVTANGIVNQTFAAGTGGTGTLTANSTITKTGTGRLTLGGATNIDLNGSVDVQGGNLALNDNASVAPGQTLRTSGDLIVAAGTTLTGEGDLTLIATGGSINGSGTIQANSGVGTQGDLTLRQGNSLNLANLTFGNQSTTDLIAQSYNGGVTIDKTKPVNAADQWQSIAAMAQGDVVLSGNGDITTNAMTSKAGNIEIESAAGDLILSGPLTAGTGGVSLISGAGKIYTPGGSNDTLNVPITGYSDSFAATGVDLPYGSGKTAIMISSSKDLILGPGAVLTANGLYNAANYDDRESVDFDTSMMEGGDPLDVAIYLGCSRLDPPVGTITVNNLVQLADNGSMVVDAGEKVVFGNEFGKSVFNQTQSLEVVSRRSQNLDEVIRYNRLPFAETPEEIRNWFNETSTGYFAGTYALRGVRMILAEILALSNPVPLVPPRPLEPEIRGEVKGPDTEALAKLLKELGIGVQPYVTKAYADSLSTDLRLYKAAEKLQELMPALEDVNGVHIAGLRETVAEYFPTLDVLSEERVDSFAQVLASHKGDGTDFDLAGQCISALTEYVNILSTDIGWPVEKSVEFVMGRYVPRLTENDEIRIAVIQMQLQKEL